MPAAAVAAHLTSDIGSDMAAVLSYQEVDVLDHVDVHLILFVPDALRTPVSRAKQKSDMMLQSKGEVQGRKAAAPLLSLVAIRVGASRTKTQPRLPEL